MHTTSNVHVDHGTEARPHVRVREYALGEDGSSRHYSSIEVGFLAQGWGHSATYFVDGAAAPQIEALITALTEALDESEKQ